MRMWVIIIGAAIAVTFTAGVIIGGSRTATSDASKDDLEGGLSCAEEDVLAQLVVEWVQRLRGLGVYEPLREAAQALCMGKDFDKAIDIYEAALENARDDHEVALYLRGAIVMCCTLKGDRAAALAAATGALPVSRKMRQSGSFEGLTLVVANTSLYIPQVLILWKENASRQELSEAIDLAELAADAACQTLVTLTRVTEECTASETGMGNSSLRIQALTWRGRILGARGRARLGDVGEAEKTLRTAVQECTHWETVPLSRYCLGKSLVEWGRPEQAVELLREALPQYDAAEREMSGIVRCLCYDWYRDDVERLLAEVDPGQRIAAPPHLCRSREVEATAECCTSSGAGASDRAAR